MPVHVILMILGLHPRHSPLPGCPRAAASPAGSSAASRAGVTPSPAGDPSAKHTKSHWHSGSHPFTPHQSCRDPSHSTFLQNLPRALSVATAQPRPLQGRLSWVLAPVSPHLRDIEAQHPRNPLAPQTPQTTPKSQQRVALWDGDETTALRRTHQQLQRLWRRRRARQEVVRDIFMVGVRGQKPPLPRCLNISACSAISQLKCNYLPNTQLYITPLLLSSWIFFCCSMPDNLNFSPFVPAYNYLFAIIAY